MNDPRLDWDHYFMGLAHFVATRSTCLRRHVGAVLVQQRAVRGTGYNGAPAKIPSCIELGECLMRDGNCIRTNHAEQNLILQTDAAERAGATVYLTDAPCWRCANLLANSGIAEVVYDQAYARDAEAVSELLADAGIVCRKLKSEIDWLRMLEPLKADLDPEQGTGQSAEPGS